MAGTKQYFVLNTWLFESDFFLSASGGNPEIFWTSLLSDKGHDMS